MAEKCATIHTAMIYDRGGKQKMSQLRDAQQVRWTRVLDGSSDAAVTIEAENCTAQADELAAIEPRRHEMVLFRGDDRVWEGPIDRVSWRSSGVEISAGDCLDYLNSTPLSKAWPGPADGGPNLMTARIDQIIRYELTTPYVMTTNKGNVTVPRWEGITTPINVLPFLEVRPGSVLTRSSTVAFEMTLGEHLKALGRSGMDYTMVGRQLLIWDSDNSIGEIRQLTEADFLGDIDVFSDGSDHADVAHVSANRTSADLDAGVGNAGEVDPYYGVWTAIKSSQSEEGSDQPTQAELNSQGQRMLTGRTPIPIYLRVPESAGIRLSHDLTINDLIPGVRVPVLALLNLKRVSQMQRLKKLTVTETGAGEQVAVSLTTTGVDD